MLMQVDSMTLGKNLFLIVGAVILLIFVVFLIIVSWTGINMLIFHVKRKRAEREHFEQTRREDGELYPQAIEGVCEVCKRGGGKIYFPQGGFAMCPPCYESWWRDQRRDRTEQSRDRAGQRRDHTEQSRDREGAGILTTQSGSQHNSR